jgi:hypothetical protein
MAKSTNTCNSILALLFNATTFDGFAENDSTSPFTDLYLSLHTTDPGVGGNQTTGEATFTSYARLAVARTTGGWEVPAAGSTSNAAIAQFIECTGGSNAIDYVAIGTAASGAGTVLYAGQLSATRTISSGIQAQFNANALVVTET